MRSYGKIESAFWQNPKIKSLSDTEKLFLIYLYTTHHGNSLGCFVLPIGYISADMNWSFEQVTKHVSELVTKGFIEWDNAYNLIKIIGWFDHNTIENDNVAKAAIKTFKTLPECKITNILFNDLVKIDNKFINKLINELRNGLPYQFLNPEPEPKPDPEPKSSHQEPDPAGEKGDDFFAKCFEFITARFPQLVPSNSAPIYAWKQAGYDFETQIKPTIESAKAKGINPKSFNYFSSMLEELATKKIAEAPKPERKLSAEEIERNRKFIESMGIVHATA